jgi:uncharacterized protein with HEPN domain
MIPLSAWPVEAIGLLGGRSVEDLAQNRVLQLALVRLVEVIGEAASKVPADFRGKHPDAWREAVAMRNLLIHGYDIIEHRILWETITSDLPALVEQLRKTMAPYQNYPISGC